MQDFDTILAIYNRGAPDRAWEQVRALLLDQPTHVPGLILAGVITAQRLELEAALSYFDRALAIDADNPIARFNKGGVLLMRGDWEAGLPMYEARLRMKELGIASSSVGGLRPWRGQEPLAGRRILIRCEQGLGDTLQFCRYVALVAELGGEVVLQVQRPLVTLLCDLPGISRIVMVGAAPPDCDYECPLLSLPLAFGTTTRNIPASSPYLRSDPGKVQQWRDRLGPRRVPRIGLVWRGTAANSHDGQRSLPLPLLARSLPRQFEYHSLQKELVEEDRMLLRQHSWIADHAAELHDFSDTAALCECLDLVISIDTSVAHVSAGLGRPTWILLHFAPGWRWLLNRSDTPWYSCATLLRQEHQDDWASVCATLASRLQQFDPIEGVLN